MIRPDIDDIDVCAKNREKNPYIKCAFPQEFYINIVSWPELSEREIKLSIFCFVVA